MQFRCTSSIFLRKTRFYSVFFLLCDFLYNVSFPPVGGEGKWLCKMGKSCRRKNFAQINTQRYTEIRIRSWRNNSPHHTLFIYYFNFFFIYCISIRTICAIIYDIYYLAVCGCVLRELRWERKIVSEIFSTSVNDDTVKCCCKFQRKFSFSHPKIACMVALFLAPHSFLLYPHPKIIKEQARLWCCYPRRAAFSKLQIHYATSV